MPYGIDKAHGGDSPENVKKMEACVASVMKDDVSKESAIRICKDRLFSHKEKDSEEKK